MKGLEEVHTTKAKIFLQDLGVDWIPLGQKLNPNERIIAYLRENQEFDQIACCSLSTEIDILEAPRSKPPLFVSYYTRDTPYEQLSEQLRKSLDKYQLPHRIEPIASTGTWVGNTGLKSRFIERVWNEHDGPICWIDADAEILRPPSLIYDNPFDIALVRRDGWYDMSGFVFLNKSDAVGRLISTWVDLCQRNPNVWDQVLLTLAWHKRVRNEPLSSLWLSDGIFRFPRPRIRDLRDQLLYFPFKKKIQPFIDQKQASRTLKEFMDASKNDVDERSSGDISQRFRHQLQSYDFSTAEDIESIF